MAIFVPRHLGYRHVSRRSVAIAALLLLAGAPVVRAAAPEPAAPPAPAATPGRAVPPNPTRAVRVRAARIERDPQATPPGIVTLEVAAPEAGDPPDTVRLEAVLHGPLAEESGKDLYALNAVLTFPPTHLEFVAGTLRKGELLGVDGRDVLITGRVLPERDGALSIGSSRLGPVPGVAAPAKAARLFSCLFRAKQGGAAALGWNDATFIDSKVRGVAAARFVGGTLTVELEPAAPAAGP